ncbi:hypothetical protein SK128_015242 [Halocaridina rubra]|uniref:Aminopeptidase N-like N-terminal domain-containing protein n=1 Tax=Halocaridina rubra TaxID=373956 RepID=A0AAN9AFF3_HALRR
MPENEQKRLKTSTNEPWEDDFRLPSTVQPHHYDLYLYPDLTTQTFTGSVAINVTSSETRDVFLIHTKWLNITNTKISQVDESGSEIQEVEIVDLFEFEPNEFWVIRTNSTEPGTYKIWMDFSGSLTTGIVGFYYSEYADSSGNSRGLATTKFEPTYARRAFPCFDEPSFKSTYTIKIVRPSDGYIALSNMPVEVGS